VPVVRFEPWHPRRGGHLLLRELWRRAAEDTGPERRGAAPGHRRAGRSAGPEVGYGASVPNIPNYLVQAVLLTVVCLVLSPFTLFFPFLGVITGVVAIVYGAQVNGKVAGGNYVGARDSSRPARAWTWITFAILIVELLVLAAIFPLSILVLVAGASA
jgi:hypothetical protein